MPKKLTIIASMLCDYVGKGNANKHTLVNVIAGDVIVAAIPAELAFGFYFEVAIDRQEATTLSLEALIGGKQLFSASAMGTPVGGIGSQSAALIIPLVSFRLEQETELEVYASAEGYARTRLMKRRISKGDLSNAFRPPTEQSPPDAPDSSSQPAPSRPSGPTRRRQKKAQ